jgi:hypothetical protein
VCGFKSEKIIFVHLYYSLAPSTCLQ